MNLSHSPYAAYAFVTALLAVMVAFYTWPRRQTAGAIPLTFIALAIAVWVFGYGMEILATDLASKIWWGKVQYIGIALAPYLWLWLSLSYTNQWNEWLRRIFPWLALVPLATILLAFTTERHGLIWHEIYLETVSSFSLLGTSYGVWFWLHTAVSYLFLLAGTLMMLRALWHRRGMYRAQLLVMLIGVFFPWVGNFLYLSNLGPIPGLDLTPFSFAITVLALTWGIVGYRLVDIVPIARDLILEGLRDGVIVVNDQARIADMNPAAARVIGLPVPHVLGRQVHDVLAPWPALLAQIQPGQEGQGIMVVGQGEAQMRHEVQIVPLYDGRQRPLGHILTIRQAEHTAVSAQQTPPEQLNAKETAVSPPRSDHPFILAVTRFFIPSALATVTPIPGYTHAISQLLERAFTAMLRIGTLLATAALLLNSRHMLQAGAAAQLLTYLAGLLFLTFLATARQISFIYRARLFLLTLYGIAFTELISYGYTVETFLFFFTLSALATLLLNLRGAIAVLLINLATLAFWGWQMIQGAYQPLATSPAHPLYPLAVEPAAATLFVFAAVTVALMAAITLLVQNLTRTWQQETQAKNLLQIERDTLDQRVLERTRQLRNREAILEAVSFSSEQLLISTDWREIISGILAELGRAAEASRVYIFERHITPPEEPDLVSQKYEWVAPGVEPQIDNPSLQNLLTTFVPRWVACFARGQMISGLVRDFPEVEKAILEPQGIISILVVPIMVHGDWWGFIGFDECTGERIWTTAEIEALHIAATNLGAVIQRQQQEEALRQSEARQHALLSAIPDLMFRSHRDGTFLDYHAGNPNELIVPPEVFLGKKTTDVLPPELAQAHMAYIEQVLQTGKECIYEYTVPIKGKLLDFEARMVPSGPDEVLAIVRNVTERRNLQAQTLALAIERERSQMLRQFVRDISHEFRTPLAVIGMTLATLGYIKDEARRQMALQRAQQQIPRLTRLLEMTLSMVRLDNEDVTLKYRQLEANHLVERALNSVQSEAREKGIQLAFDKDALLPSLWGDSELLQEALEYLLDNAVRFTDKGGSVYVRTFRQEAEVLIAITDTGIGMSSEVLARIFERFWRLDEAHTLPGFGLGLPLAQKIVQLHNGRITVKSEVGVGSTFTVHLPTPIDHASG